MKVVVDFEVCMGNGHCMLAAPEVFNVHDDGTLEVLIENPDETLRAKVAEAARVCPTQAITIAE